jgi:hypothetical protein
MPNPRWKAPHHHPYTLCMGHVREFWWRSSTSIWNFPLEFWII